MRRACGGKNPEVTAEQVCRGLNLVCRTWLDRLRGTTDQQAVNDGVTPGKRATVPSWDEIVFGTRRRKSE